MTSWTSELWLHRLNKRTVAQVRDDCLEAIECGEDYYALWGLDDAERQISKWEAIFPDAAPARAEDLGAVLISIAVLLPGYESDYEGPIPAWSSGDRWNGFECPLFTEEQLPAVLAILAGTWKREGDAILVRFFGAEDQEIRYDRDANGLWEFPGLCWERWEPPEPE